MPKQQKMFSSANNVNNNNNKSININNDEINHNESESVIKCQCLSSRIHRCHRTYRDDNCVGSLLIYIYMWITIFAICCSGLPPVIKIGKCSYVCLHEII